MYKYFITIKKKGRKVYLLLCLRVLWNKLLHLEGQDGGLPRAERYRLCPFPNHRADEAEGLVMGVHEETLQGLGAKTEDRVFTAGMD